jgi:DnaJ-class molecular chaperone
MNKCTLCNGEGLIAQGESIKNVCKHCSGTGKASFMEETQIENEEVSATEEKAEESFLEGSGEVLAPAPENEEVPATEESSVQ